MAKINYTAVKGSNTMGSKPFYIGIVQHGRVMSKKETYAYCAERTGYKATAIKAAFLAFREFIKENQAKGNITHADGIAYFRNDVRGAFDTLSGPWVKGRNMLIVNAVEIDPFRSVLSDITPVNRTEGANPTIDTVFDETANVYNTISGTNPFSIAGADLAPDTSKDDEYVALVSAKGVETKCEITFSDLQNVKAKLAAALEPGEYTLKVYTRSGMGEEFGVKCATRKVTIA
jgi:hypothetical protein